MGFNTNIRRVLCDLLFNSEQVGRKTYMMAEKSEKNAYSDVCRTPIPIHIGQSFQFKADTGSD